MKAIEIKEVLSKYLKENGTESFTKLVSDSIDESAANNGDSISFTRENFLKKFDALSKLNLTERGKNMHPIFQQALKPFGIR